MNNNISIYDESILLTAGFKFGLTFQTLWKTGSDKKQYCCTLPQMHWFVLSGDKGLTLPVTESRLLPQETFKELFLS